METVERWTTRSDAWTTDDDQKLADIVLRHIREGSTQLNAFVEAANLLVRTPAACGYRWNGVVRRHFSDQIKQAKIDRKNLSQQKTTSSRRRSWVPDLDDASIEGIIQALRQHEQKYYELKVRNQELEAKVETLNSRLQELENENESLRSASSAQSLLNDDSRALLAIMDRARQLLTTESLKNQNSGS